VVESLRGTLSPSEAGIGALRRHLYHSPGVRGNRCHSVCARRAFNAPTAADDQSTRDVIVNQSQRAHLLSIERIHEIAVLNVGAAEQNVEELFLC